MFRAYLQLMLGKIGRALLAFYNNYNMVISPIVVLYGVVTVYAHNNLRNVIRRMEGIMVEIAGEMADQLDYRQVHRQFVQRWKAEQGDKRLFLPSQTDFWFGFMDAAELIELLHIGPDYVRMALHKHMNQPSRRSFHPVDYRLWKEYRHRLLVGLRSKLPDVKEMKARYREQQRKAKERNTRRTQKK